MPFNDDKILVYLGYPADYTSIPLWMSYLLKGETEDKEDHPYRFYVSGGSLTEEALALLSSRSADTEQAQLMSLRLSRGVPSRLIDPLMSIDIANISSLAKENPSSPEFRILLDLYVLSRSDIYLLDCNLLGGGRCGMELAYSHDSIPTVGVSDACSVDPWYHYHVDMISKSVLVPSHLAAYRSLILSSRHTLPKEDE